MNKIIFLTFCILSISFSSVFSQEVTPPSIFDEGVDTTINPEDIGDDVRQWAQNTALKFRELLKQLKKIDMANKRIFLINAITESVREAQNTKELLLMRFSLNRALRLEQTFQGQDDALAVNYVLLPAVKQAMTLYEQADLPYLEANQGKPEGEIIPPYYANFTKYNVGFLLVTSIMNKTLEGQFEILKLAIAWMAKDLLRSPESKRNPTNARIIVNLELLDHSLKDIQCPTQSLNNMIRSTLLDSAHQIVPEANSKPTPAIVVAPEPPPPPVPVEVSKPVNRSEKKKIFEIVTATKARSDKINECITTMEIAIDYVETVDDFIELLKPGVSSPTEEYLLAIDHFVVKYAPKFLSLSPTILDITRVKTTMTNTKPTIEFLETCISASNSPVGNRADLLEITEPSIAHPNEWYSSKLSELRNKYKDRF